MVKMQCFLFQYLTRLGAGCSFLSSALAQFTYCLLWEEGIASGLLFSR